jgi:cob(I)alamin adenosyltransferase
MSQLDQATKRLEAALDRLEQALERKSADGEERELRSALVAARQENAALQEVARTVAGRLDGTIARLKASQ